MGEVVGRPMALGARATVALGWGYEPSPQPSRPKRETPAAIIVPSSRPQRGCGGGTRWRESGNRYTPPSTS
jgi:hypothetical protein